MQEKINGKKHYIVWSLLAALLSIMAVCLALALLGVYPFGGRSILTNDCYVQYVDFYHYFKRVLAGEAGLGYTFSKSIGGSAVALFGYYLASPLNLLVVFFKDFQLETFVFTVSILRVGLCGFAFAWFIQHRLKNLKPICVLMTSLAYAYTQYNAEQLSNLSWLDGVYMLPFILLGVWLYVSEKKKGTLCISIALSILFNWYTGYMNCIFAAIYFFYEQIQWNAKTNELTVKRTAVQFIKYCGFEILGVMLSCFLFVPVVLGQSSGRGIMDSGVFSYGTNGRLLDILRGFSLGVTNSGFVNDAFAITLFCGTIVLLFATYYFVSDTENRTNKICMGILIGVMILSEFLQPLEHIWCGFKIAESFRIRFAYITIFTLIFAGARGMEQIESVQKKRFVQITAVWAAVFIILDGIKAFDDKAFLVQLATLAFCGVAIYMSAVRVRYAKVLYVGLLGVLFGETVINSYCVNWAGYQRTAGQYASYTQAQTKLVESIQSQDESLFYRMDQNKTRENRQYAASFLLNESLAYGYSGISQYSSAYDNKTVQFLTSLGYCKGYFPTFYHEPIVSSDSLLGIKYLMSTKAFEGYEIVDNIEVQNEKSVYLNPYALPLGFGADEAVLKPLTAGDAYNASTIDTDNPFEFQNKVYSALLGEEIRIYEPLEATHNYNESEGVLTYLVKDFDEEDIVYGYNRSWIDRMPLTIDGIFTWHYKNGWGDMGVFQVGHGGVEHCVEFALEDAGKAILKDYEQELWQEANGLKEETAEPRLRTVFYALNMDTFEKAIDRLRQNVFDLKCIEDGYVLGNYQADEDGWLMLTILNEESWDVHVNGVKVEPNDGMSTFMTIPVSRGANTVEMQYRVKGVKEGAVISVAALVILAGISVFERRKRKNI